MAPPLIGITVVDLTRVLAGPYCTMLLADMGAEVIKIERPDGGDDTRGFGPPYLNGESAMFLAINRNKQSMTLNLKHPSAKKILTQLIE
jgi:glutaryl-CoA transferase